MARARTGFRERSRVRRAIATGFTMPRRERKRGREGVRGSPWLRDAEEHDVLTDAGSAAPVPPATDVESSNRIP